jgi:hypothetical protein
VQRPASALGQFGEDRGPWQALGVGGSAALTAAVAAIELALLAQTLLPPREDDVTATLLEEEDIDGE